MKTVILALAFSLSGANAPSPKQEVTVAGQYCGRLWSNGALVQANTTARRYWNSLRKLSQPFSKKTAATAMHRWLIMPLA